MKKKPRPPPPPDDALPIPRSARIALAIGHAFRRSLAGSGSGPLVARLFGRLFALTSIVAWLSLGAQIDVLVGRRGLLPVEPWIAEVNAQRAGWLDAPTIFRLGASDGALHAGIAAGVLLSALALLGVWPRLCFALSTILYLSFAVACRTFLGFQWDNLLLECGFLAVLLPRDRAAPWAHALLRVLLFKLYWESGLAKWGSPLHDWQDGSAMTFYYETAPLPARLAPVLHAMPAWFHHAESGFTLAFELILPVAIFGPRRARLAAAGTFTLFQIVNIATANYGFFAYLAIALHVFLLDEGDLFRARKAIERRFPWVHRLRLQARLVRLFAARCSWILRLRQRLTPAIGRARVDWIRRAGAVAACAFYGSASLAELGVHFGESRDLAPALAPFRELYAPLRIVNAYHLFAAITRERVEPEIQTFDGQRWTTHDLRYKPGDPARAPGFVAPHQPRVDFLFWFYGLSFRRGTPPYAAALLDRVCHDPSAVAPLFREPLPQHPRAARIGFQRYHFTSPEEARRTGTFWTREWIVATPRLECE